MKSTNDTGAMVTYYSDIERGALPAERTVRNVTKAKVVRGNLTAVEQSGLTQRYMFGRGKRTADMAGQAGKPIPPRRGMNELSMTT